MARKSKPLSEDARPDWALRLARMRKSHGVSQAQVAGVLGLSQSAYADYETGRSEPSLRMFASLANILNTKAVWLAYGVGDREGEEAPYALDTPALRTRRQQDPLFASVSDKVIEIFKQEMFFPEDASLIVVLSEKIAERIRSAYIDTEEALNMAIGNTDYFLTKVIRDAKEELRISLLTNPEIYLPRPPGLKFKR